MADAAWVDGEAAGMPIWDEGYSLGTSRHGLRDLATLVALPAIWVDQDPTTIADGLLGVLFEILDPEYAYARFNTPTGEPPLECWRPEGPRAPIELETVLTVAPARMPGSATVPVATRSGDGVLRITSISRALPAAEGLVVVGSRHRDFPTDLDRYVLQVAVDLAAVSIHAARRLDGERAARITAETTLRQRNAFLETLAQDLERQLTPQPQRAAQSREFATTADGPMSPRTNRSSHAAIARLTRREAEVLGLLARGLSNKEIGSVLRLSERTIERHITGLYGKLQVRRRSQATAFAILQGLVEIEVDTGLSDSTQTGLGSPV